MAQYDASKDGRREEVKISAHERKNGQTKECVHMCVCVCVCCASDEQAPRAYTVPCQCLSIPAKRLLVERYTLV